MTYRDWPRWINLEGSVPALPAPTARPNTTLRYAEAMRSYVWNAYPYNKRQGASDWDPMSRGYPADPTGVCRHKVAWLQNYLGGVPLYGRRTDKANAEMHAVLWFKVGSYGFIADYDGIWPERSAPFTCDASHKAYRT